jgi:hypothetical protein
MEEYIKNKIKKFYKDKKQKEILNTKYITKRYEDIIFRITNNLATRAYKYLLKYNIEKKITHMELIGCTHEELKIHIEKQFTDGMNFENYSEWEIDHIKPISLFNLNNENELIECFNYKNLQPLWRLDNIKKSNKII